MAKLIPSYHSIDLNELPYSERCVLETLHKMHFPGLEVYYSVALVRERKNGTFRSEADFILFHPEHGILVWEVKGGAISYENNRWFSTNRDGTHGIKDPVKQADSAIGDLIKRISKHLGSTAKMPIGRNLVFPDARAHQIVLPLGLVRADIIDCDDFSSLTPDALRAQFQRWPHQDHVPLNAMVATRLRNKVLNPTFHLAPAIDAQIDQVESRLVQLTNQQIWALQLLQFVPRLTITGGAGTGKTLLARQKAKELAEDGHRVLALCFNQSLAKYLKEGLSDIESQRPGNLTTASFHDFARSIIEPAGYGWHHPQDAEEQRFFYEETVPEQLEAAGHTLDEKYDALIVDEAQDFHPLWWVALQSVLTPKAKLFLFADPSQNLYGRDFEIPTDIFDELPSYPFHLTFNCRNSKEIAYWLSNRFEFSSLASATLPSSGYSVEQHSWQTPDQQEDLLVKAWESLKNHGVASEQVAILSPYRPEKSAGIRAIQSAFPKAAFITSTISGFKGLQAPFVFLVDMNTGSFASREDLWYVGATRATVGLQTFEKVTRKESLT
ncbi:AAA family ATPase [Marinobacter sp.]|uniref:AAA family ATPase n=1 Tax=Marinobacter sp. TaxID=50741 RepID=UPI003A8EAF60